MRICELKQKEVINICTCRTLGCPVDVEFNCETGCITALVAVSYTHLDVYKRQTVFPVFVPSLSMALS